MNKEINILLIGSTGSGKSSLANLLINKNGNFEKVFKESAGSISETKEHQTTVFEEEGTTYRIIDTISFDDTSLSEQDIACKLVELAEEIRGGINQILFVTDGRFTEKEVGIFGMLGSGLFDEEIFDYTTIVRTRFSSFEDPEKCKEDYQNLAREGEIGSKLVNRVGKVIHIDNPPLESSNSEIISIYKEIKGDARSMLLKHLKKCRTTYESATYQNLNRKIDELGEDKNDKNKVSSVSSDIFKDSFRVVKESTKLGAKIGEKVFPGVGPAVGGLIGLGASFSGSLIYTGVRLTEELLKSRANRTKDLSGAGSGQSQELSNLQAENSRLKSQEIQNKNTIANLRQEISNEGQAQIDLNKTINTLRAQVSSVQSEKEDLTREMRTLRTDRQTAEANLNRTITELRSQLTNSQSQISQFQNERTAFTQQVQNLQQQVQNLRGMLSSVVSAEAKIQQPSFPPTGNN